MAPQISIIVPAFKVEYFLRTALNSILAQTFTNWEAILVDDCSPDNSGLICDEYVNKDKRFKVVHKVKNEGLFLARKSGLDIASGEYIAHLDSDDYYDPKFLEKMHNKAMEIAGGYDMVFCGYRVVDLKGKLIRETTFKKDFVLEENKAKRLEDYFTKKYFQFALWNTLIKKEFYDKVIFPDIFLNHREDSFNYNQLYFFLNTAALLKENLYSWVRYENTSSNFVTKTADELLRLINMEKTFYEYSCKILKNFNDEEYLNAFIRCYSPFFSTSKARYFSLPKKERAKLKEMNFLEDLSALHKHAKLKNKIQFFFASLLNL